jgi:hypothetical protein
MDTLVLSASSFLIPINVAAIKGKYDLMNIYTLLCLTSWAHHSNMHVSGTQSIYDDLDKLMCYYAIYYTFLYAITQCCFVRFVTYCVCLIGVFISYYYVHQNSMYTTRGLENWHCHVPHLVMHSSACLGFLVIL